MVLAPSRQVVQFRRAPRSKDSEYSEERTKPTRQFIADDGRNYKEVDSITRLVKNADGAVKPIRWPGLISMCLRSLPGYWSRLVWTAHCPINWERSKQCLFNKAILPCVSLTCWIILEMSRTLTNDLCCCSFFFRVLLVLVAAATKFMENIE